MAYPARSMYLKESGSIQESSPNLVQPTVAPALIRGRLLHQPNAYATTVRTRSVMFLPISLGTVLVIVLLIVLLR
jgi:hypothetical protein